MIEEIKYAEKLWIQQKEIVERESCFEKFALENFITTVKSFVSRYDLFTGWEEAQKQLNKKMSVAPQLETLKSFVRKDFLSNDENFKFVEIICVGYDACAWGITVEGYGKVLRITIPIKENLNKKNFHLAHNGMFSVSVQTSPSVWSVIKRAYDLSDMLGFMREFCSSC